MKVIDTMMIIEQADSTQLASCPQFDSVAQDTTEFITTMECNPNTVIESVNKENNLYQIPVSVIVSIVIFVLGWLFTRLFKRIDECFARKRYREAVLKWIDLIMPTEYILISNVWLNPRNLLRLL